MARSALVFALLALGFSGSSEARENMPLRRAVVIGADHQETLEARVSPEVSPTLLDGFRVHDLSRSWVEHQMRGAIADSASKPIGPQPVPIEVPAWMRPASAPIAWRGPSSCGAPVYRPSGLLDYAGEARRRAVFDDVHAAACMGGIPTALLDALIIQESRYQPGALSPKRAYGYTQLMPGTALGLGVDRFDPLDNLRGGARYLRDQLDKFGRVELALAAYNAGPGRVVDRVPAIAETRAYVAAVLHNWRILGAPVAATPLAINVGDREREVPPVSAAVLLSF